MIKLLIHLGASLKPINFAGKTPLDILKDNDLEFLANKESKEENKFASPTPHKFKATPMTTMKVEIEDTKEEMIEDIFSNIRSYFRDKGYLTPKDHTETAEIIGSCISNTTPMHRNTNTARNRDIDASIATNED
jgi:uncharacterized protein (UPF0297 family)